MQKLYPFILFFMGIVYPFSVLAKMNLLKMQLHLGRIKGLPFAFKICLATMGVAFLSALTTVGALFYFTEKCNNDHTESEI